MAEGSEFAGNPYDMAVLFSQGGMSREQVILALVSWDYVPAEKVSPLLHEDPPNYVPGSIDDLVAAFDDDLIDEEIHYAVRRALKSRAAEL